MKSENKKSILQRNIFVEIDKKDLPKKKKSFLFNWWKHINKNLKADPEKP